MASITFNYTIPFGSSLRVGWRPQGSASPFTYLTTFPAFDESPYTITGIPSGPTDVEVTTLCPSCSGSTVSTPYIFQANAT